MGSIFGTTVTKEVFEETIEFQTLSKKQVESIRTIKDSKEGGNKTLVWSIKSWSLKDENSQPVPITIENIDRLRTEAILEMNQIIVDLNGWNISPEKVLYDGELTLEAVESIGEQLKSYLGDQLSIVLKSPVNRSDFK